MILLNPLSIKIEAVLPRLIKVYKSCKKSLILKSASGLVNG
nr:MAG TPA: hypothetical protein [Caudoviricetes sp.]